MSNGQMKKLVVLGVVLAGIVALLGIVRADEMMMNSTGTAKMSGMKKHMHEGKVISVDASMNKLVVKSEKENTYMTTADTKIMKGDKKIMLSDIMVGDWVTVRYMKMNDMMTASSIKVHMPKKMMGEKKGEGMGSDMGTGMGTGNK